MSLGKNTLLNLSGAIIPMFVTLLTVPLLLDMIGLERYGILAIIWVLLGYFGFMDFGFGRAVAQRMAKMKNATEEERSRLLWTALSAIFLLGIVAAFILGVFSDYILPHVIDVSNENYVEISKSIFWLIIVLPILLPSSVLSGALQGREQFLSLNIINIIGATLGQFFPLIMAWNGYIGLDFLVPAVLSARIISLVLTFVVCKRDRSLLGLPSINMDHLRPLMSYGGWISVISILGPLLVTIDKLVIAGISGVKSVTFYTIPYNLVSRVLVIPSSLSGAIFPRFAYADENEEDTLSVNATRTLVTVMTPIVMIGIILLNPFLAIWIDKEFAIKSKGVGELLLLGIWINGIVYVYHAKILATRSPKILVFLYLFEIPIYFLLLWMGLSFFGIIGAAGAWTLRVIMDTTAILYLSDAIADTLNYAWVPFIFLMVTLVTVVLFGNDFFVCFSLGMVLVTIFVTYDRKQIAVLVNKYYMKDKNGSV